MSLVYKTDSHIVGDNPKAVYDFGSISGVFNLEIPSGNIQYAVLVDGKKTDLPINVNNQHVSIEIESSVRYVFKLYSISSFSGIDVLETDLISGRYYELKDIDCNFVLTFDALESVNVFLENDSELVNNEVVGPCEIHWPTSSKSILKLTSFSGKSIPINLRRT